MSVIAWVLLIESPYNRGGSVACYDGTSMGTCTPYNLSTDLELMPRQPLSEL